MIQYSFIFIVFHIHTFIPVFLHTYTKKKKHPNRPLHEPSTGQEERVNLVVDIPRDDCPPLMNLWIKFMTALLSQHTIMHVGHAHLHLESWINDWAKENGWIRDVRLKYPFFDPKNMSLYGIVPLG